MVAGMAPMNNIGDYLNTIKTSQQPNYTTDGFVWIETDAKSFGGGTTVDKWASAQLGELTYLKGIVEGTSTGGALTVTTNGNLMKGIVPWAPINRGVEGFQEYLKAAEQKAGKETWSRVKGFRYLLQGIYSEASFKKLVEDPNTIKVLQSFGDQYSFDVGVDLHRAGAWQLERVAGLIDAVSASSKTKFILSKSFLVFLLQLTALLLSS
jgi:L-rhamnono-1,4-lactonase